MLGCSARATAGSAGSVLGKALVSAVGWAAGAAELLVRWGHADGNGSKRGREVDEWKAREQRG